MGRVTIVARAIFLLAILTSAACSISISALERQVDYSPAIKTPFLADYHLRLRDEGLDPNDFDDGSLYLSGIALCETATQQGVSLDVAAASMLTFDGQQLAFGRQLTDEERVLFESIVERVMIPAAGAWLCPLG